MPIGRINRIILRLVQELLLHPRIQALTKFQPAQQLITNVLPKVSNQISKQIRTPLRTTIFKSFRTLRGRHQLLRPFATLHYHNARLREFERSRGFLLLHGREKSDVIGRVRHLFGTNVRYNRNLAATEMPTSLDGYEIGDHIATGCNGAVHQLKLRDPGIRQSHSNNYYAEKCSKEYPMALKMMFNLDFKKPEHVLWREMRTELIPIAPLPKALLRGGRMAKLKTLPRPHPNVIKIYTAFMDRMPILKEAAREYPAALPDMKIRDPKTIHVVMKRYRMTLRNYLDLNERQDQWVGRILFGQLLEAIVYLHKNTIAHRDMKSDNILLDFDSDDEIPHLVLSDFGSALATGNWTVSYAREKRVIVYDDVYDNDDDDNGYGNDDIPNLDLGGNVALMAPEIRRAALDPIIRVNFEMADTWSTGTMAYEIFTGWNPFYNILSSEKYKESDLPPFPLRLIEPIKKAVYGMLSVDPKCRPKPEVVANVVAISLLRFGHNVRTFLERCRIDLGRSFENNISSALKSILSKLNDRVENSLHELTEFYAAETIILRLMDPSRISNAELQVPIFKFRLRATFLSRLERDELHSALTYFVNGPENSFEANGTASISREQTSKGCPTPI